jgi:hypothetical protein
MFNINEKVSKSPLISLFERGGFKDLNYSIDNGQKEELMNV